MKMFSNLNKRCKLIVWECAILFVCFIICGIQHSVATNAFQMLTNCIALLLPFWVISALEFICLYHESNSRKMVNAILIIAKTAVCIILYMISINWMWHESHWTPEDWAQIGIFGATIWNFLLNIGTSMVVGVFLVGDIVLVGVDVVWMIKKLAKHIQAKKQKA